MNNFIYQNVLGSQYWVNSYNKSFINIQEESNLPIYFRKKSDVFKIIKPVNNYAFHYSPFPEIIVDEYITLRQKTHAEIWVEPKGESLYALDKTWQRQFYPTSDQFDLEDNCFKAKYKFYTPWIIDFDVIVEIKEIEGSPFTIKTNFIEFKQNNNIFIEPQWVNFLIKKNGSHIKSKEYGIIDINTNAFDIIIKDKNVCQKIIEEYCG